MTGRGDHPEWAIRCPWCHASPGQRCTTPTGRRIAIPSHDARHTAWQQRSQPPQNQPPGSPR